MFYLLLSFFYIYFWIQNNEMEDLVSKIRLGDEKVFEYIKKEWGQKLRIFARSYVRLNGVSEDLVQDTFIKFWEARRTFENEKMIAPYLFTILRNKCLDYLKHKVVEQKFNDIAAENYNYWLANIYALEDPSISIITENQIKKALFDAINKMPQLRREIFIMSRFKDMKNQEVAEEMGVSVKTVEYHMTKAISFLREELKDYFVLIYFFLLR
ncbi:MAG: RNA polymerase sigma-70 factor [Bacteroidia bacterium]|nr:RNA polymerase sigma-70 factor [Bacteroidia bacterium]